MTIRLQIVMTVVFLLLFCIIYNMVRKRKLDLKLSLPWFIVLIGLIILVWIPDAIAKISDLMGVYSPVNMIFLCGFVFALILIFVLTTTVSRLRDGFCLTRCWVAEKFLDACSCLLR